MSTEAQVAWLVEPFLARHPEFVRIGRTLKQRPCGHLSLGFDIQRTSSKGFFRTTWGAGINFGLPPHFGGGVGQFLDGASGYVGQPNAQERVLDELERACSSLLPKISSLEAIIEMEPVIYPNSGISPFIKGLILAAIGRFEEAENLLGADIENRVKIDQRFAPLYANLRHGSKGWLQRQREVTASEAFVTNLRRVHDLVVRRDRSDLALLLHEWEAQAVVVKKIEDYWQPSPFPFELDAGG